MRAFTIFAASVLLLFLIGGCSVQKSVQVQNPPPPPPASTNVYGGTIVQTSE